MNVQIPVRLSIDEFFDWVEQQERKFELVRGEPRVQPYVKRGHSEIAGNIHFALRKQIDRSAYSAHQGDFAVATGPNSVRYADVMVERKSRDRGERTAAESVVLVEVLSDSTLHVDFGLKKQEYLGLPTLRVYMIVAQEFRRVWVWLREERGEWIAEPKIYDEGTIPLGSIGADLPVDDIYDGLDIERLS